MSKKLILSLCLPALLLFTSGCNLLERITGSGKPPSPQEELYHEIKYIASREEVRDLRAIRDPNRLPQFEELFWKKRDPVPETAWNEYQQEYYRRLEAAKQRFGGAEQRAMEGRMRVFMLYGPPLTVEQTPWSDVQIGERMATALEVWLYNRPAGEIEHPNVFSRRYPGIAKFVFADFSGTGIFTQIYSSEPGESTDPEIYGLSGADL